MHNHAMIVNSRGNLRNCLSITEKGVNSTYVKNVSIHEITSVHHDKFDLNTVT